MSEPSSQAPLDRKKGALMVAAAACLWGSFSVFFRPAERFVEAAGGTLSAATESFIFFAAVLVVLGPRAFFKAPLRKPTRSTWLWLALFSIADALNLLFYFGAMQRTTVAVAVLTHYLQPVLVALMTPWVMKESAPKGRAWLALSSVVGLLLLLEPARFFVPSADTGNQDHLMGALMGTASAVLFAAVVFSIKRLGSWLSADQILCWHYPGALLLLYLFIPAGEFSMGWQPWLILILAGLIPGTIGGLLFVEGVRHLAPSTAGILTLIEPLVAVVVGVVLWGERPGLVALLGAAIILLSAYRVLRQKT